MADLSHKVVELIRSRGADFNRADKRKLDEMIALDEPNLDRSHEIEAAAHEALWLVIADPLYRGDMTLADLEGEGEPDRSDLVDELIDSILG